MTTASDIDSAVSTLRTAVVAHLAAGRPAHVCADWLLGQVNQIDNRITNRLITNASTVINSPPDRRTFASADNVG
jgi:hypothetical protein